MKFFKYFLPAWFSPQAAVSSKSCLQHLFSFPEKNLPPTGKNKKMYRSSVINIDESELKTIPKILMEISAAKVKTLLEESVTCKANFF